MPHTPSSRCPLIKCFVAGPRRRVVVVRGMTRILQPNEGLSNRPQLLNHCRVFSNIGKQPGIENPLRCLCHRAMFKHPGKPCSRTIQAPVRDGFTYEQMKQRVVRCRNCPTQVSLRGMYRIFMGQIDGLVQEVAMIGHCLGPIWIVELRLFRLTAKSEV